MRWDAEASGGGRPGVPGEARARKHPAGSAPSGRPPLGAGRRGKAETPASAGGAGRAVPGSARLALDAVGRFVWAKDTCRKCGSELLSGGSARLY